MDIITYALCKKKDNEIIDMIESMEKLTVVISDSVPTVATAEPNKLYLVDTNHDGIYEEYILAEIGGVEQIVALGQVIDLTNYYTKTETNNAIKGYHQVISDTAYGNLPDATKKNGNVYYVYTETSPLDEDGVYITNSAGDTVFVKPNGNIYKNGLLYSDTFFMAPKVSYDNTNSGLTATNVQSAIDELRAKSLRIELTQAQYDVLTPEEKNNGTVYFITDANAEGDFSELEDRVDDLETSNQSALHYKGTTTTVLTDGSTVNPITIDGKQVMAKQNDIVFYQEAEFMFNGTRWSQFGDLSGLGTLAYKNGVSVSTTDGNVTGITSVGTLPSMVYDSNTKEITFNAGTLPTADTAKTFLTGATAVVT